MAYGNEVVLGWGLADFPKVGEALGIELPQSADPSEWEEWWEMSETESPELHERLGAAHLGALAGAGFTVRGHENRIGRYVIAETLLGERKFCPFVFELFFDPAEMGDTPETATFGVALSSRYFPTFLDWKSEHGTLQPVRFDAELEALIRVARHHIEAEFPIFKTATIAVVERHY